MCLKKEEQQGHILGQHTRRARAQLKYRCSLREGERDELCSIHCFDLSCRLQDLKRTASNRMPQMVKVLFWEANARLRIYLMRQDLCEM